MSTKAISTVTQGAAARLLCCAEVTQFAQFSFTDTAERNTEEVGERLYRITQLQAGCRTTRPRRRRRRSATAKLLLATQLQLQAVSVRFLKEAELWPCNTLTRHTLYIFCYSHWRVHNSAQGQGQGCNRKRCCDEDDRRVACERHVTPDVTTVGTCQPCKEPSQGCRSSDNSNSRSRSSSSGIVIDCIAQ